MSISLSSGGFGSFEWRLRLNGAFMGADAEPGGLKRFVGGDNRLDDLAFQRANPWLFLGRPIVEFQHGAVMRMAGDQEDRVDLDRFLELLADVGDALPGRRPAEIEADQGDLLLPTANTTARA